MLYKNAKRHRRPSAGTMHTRGSVLPVCAMLVAMVLWGSSFVAMKMSFTGLHPFFVIFGRLTVATICFVPFLRICRDTPLKRHHLLPLAGLVVCEPCLYFLFEIAALQYTSASQASMITAILPLMVAMVARVLFGETLSLQVLLGFCIAAAGAVWLTLASSTTLQAPKPILGNFLEFMAMVCAAGYIILAKKLTRELSPVFLTATQSVGGALFFFPFLFWPSVTFPTGLPMQSLLIVLYLGMFVSAGAYGLYNFGVSRLPAGQASSFINLIPVFSIALGFLLLGERLNFWQIIACLVVFAGVMMSQGYHRESKTVRRI